MPKPILNHLWQVGGEDLSAVGDAAAYLVQFGPKAALIDAGCGRGRRRLINNIKACLSEETRLEYLLLTHCHYDHSGGAAAVRDEFGCKIVAHALDAVYLERGDSQVTAASWYGAQMAPLPVDIHLEGDENEIALGGGKLEAIHWPGHSPGSVVYTTRMEDQLVLFGQDIHGPIHPALLSDRGLYEKSLKRLLSLQADLLLEGHFGIIRGKAAVKQFIGSYLSASVER